MDSEKVSRFKFRLNHDFCSYLLGNDMEKKLNARQICGRRRLKLGKDFVKAVNHW